MVSWIVGDGTRFRKRSIPESSRQCRMDMTQIRTTEQNLSRRRCWAVTALAADLEEVAA